LKTYALIILRNAYKFSGLRGLAVIQQTLIIIRDFANRIDCSDFADVFDSAIRLLNGSEESEAKSAAEPPQLPPRNQRIFKAAGAAEIIFDVMLE
jgi:hypothetical protein